jgi:DNA primase
LAIDGREFKFMFLPEGHDPDTLVAEEGAEAFENRLKDALPLSEYVVQQLILDVNLEHPDGRASLKALAEPLFGRMPEGVYRELLAERLAARVSMPVKALKESFAQGRSPKSNRPEPGAGGRGLTSRGSAAAAGGASAGGASAGRSRAGRISAGRGNLLTQAIALVVHHPRRRGHRGTGSVAKARGCRIEGIIGTSGRHAAPQHGDAPRAVARPCRVWKAE